MFGELLPATAAGSALVERAERHLGTLAERAGKTDDTGAYVDASMRELADGGVLGACAPEEFGGLGVRSLHDVLVAVSRLGRGCGSTAICANMHMVGVWHQVRAWEQARAEGDGGAEEYGAAVLTALGGGDLIVGGAASEAGGLWNVPRTELVPDGDDYLLNGRKCTATNAQFADTIAVTARVPDPDGGYRHARALVHAGAPGLEVLDDWDALGMRGSGSRTVVFRDCRVPADRVRIGGLIGVPAPEDLVQAMAANLPLVGAYLGIAEAAYDVLLRQAASAPRTRDAAHATYHGIHEIEMALAAVRGALERSARAADELLAGTGAPEPDRVHRVFAGWQAAKSLVNREAVAVVDRCAVLYGGRSYQRLHPLSRMCRDVRAGAYMQPFALFEAPAFVGRTVLGLDPFEGSPWSAV